MHLFNNRETPARPRKHHYPHRLRWHFTGELVKNASPPLAQVFQRKQVLESKNYHSVNSHLIPWEGLSKLDHTSPQTLNDTDNQLRVLKGLFIHTLPPHPSLQLLFLSLFSQGPFLTQAGLELCFQYSALEDFFFQTMFNTRHHY